MGFELTTPGNTSVPKVTPVTFTHIQLTGLIFDFPPNKVQARIIWYRGRLDGGGKFIPDESKETLVSEAATRNWLTQVDTDAVKNFRKLESAMFSYLTSIGEITPGTVVDIPE